MGRVVGIDLGTTNSAVAAVNEYGRPEVLVNDYGERVTPSVVLFDGTTALVGTEARNSAVLRPADTVQFVKRQMGNADWAYYPDDGDPLTAEQVSALILAKLKSSAERILGEPVTGAVISVPAYFDDAKRKATIDAATIAGLDVLRIINEPTAAAIAHGLDSQDHQRLLVFDLGGGTFDVTAMVVRPGDLEVVATGGDPMLGGFDWDNALMSHLNERFKAAGGPDLFASPETEQDLRGKAEQMKKRLSQVDHASSHVGAAGFTERLTVTRAEFEDLTGSLLDRTAIILDKVREEAGWSWGDIDSVLMVGGSTRMPQVLRLVREVTGLAPDTGINPDEAVAMGAAIQAALLDDQPGKQLEVRTQDGRSVGDLAVRDVTAHSLGIVIIDEVTGAEVNSILIPKNTPIPASRGNIYGTVQPNQTEYHCQVTEGEEEDLRYVHVVGDGNLQLPGGYGAGAPMEVVMSYDADGIIHVHVTDLVASRPLGEVRIDRRSNLGAEALRSAQSMNQRMDVE